MTSYIRVLHASPDAPAIDVYNDSGSMVARCLVYSDFTEYLPVPSGSYTVRCIPPGAEEPVLDTTINIPDGTVCTVAASGDLDGINVLTISESPMYIPQDRSCLRFANLSPDCPEVDVVLSEADTLCSGISYGDVSEYMAIEPGTYSLQVVASGSDNVILTVPNQTFTSGRYYTAYAVGRYGDSSLQMHTPLDGISYIKL